MANKALPSITKHSARNQARTRQHAAQLTDYDHVQSDEIEALQAIYFDEFETLQVKSAWNKSIDKAFRLTLRSLSSHDVSLVLSVRFTATYPKTAPVVTAGQYNAVRVETQNAITALIADKIRQLLGSVMIFEISSTIQDILEDELQHRADGEALPTLEQERASQEAEQARNAEAKQLEDDKKLQVEKEEEERHLQQMVEEEMQRRKQQQKKRHQVPALRKTTSDAGHTAKAESHSADCIVFDRDIVYQRGSLEYRFNAVRGLTRYRQGPVTKLVSVVPSLAEEAVEAPLLLMLKTCTIKISSSLDNKRILALEDILETNRGLPVQANSLRILDFKLEQQDTAWSVSILTEFANKGNLADMLAIFDTIPVPKARAWMVDLLEATEFLHSHGLIHELIHLQNIVLDQSEMGTITLKLADCSYQRILRDFNQSSDVSQARSVYWQPPELATTSQKTKSSKRERRRPGPPDHADRTRNPQGSKSSMSSGGTDSATVSEESSVFNSAYTKKTDIWALGIVFVQMLFGSEAPDMYSSPTAMIERQDLTLALETMIRQIFANDSKKRPSAFDLIPSEFLRSDVPVFLQDIDNSYDNFAMSGVAQIRSRRRRSSVQQHQYSRYLSDWIETGRLGKGGFGEVVKARNKTDGRIYAIKKITSRTNEALSSILSEVMLLSRLNHPNVVRYYSAWPEEEIDTPESDIQTTTESGTTAKSFEDEEFTFGQSTGGLDFISSSGYPKIVFGDSDDEDEDDAVAVVSDDDETTEEDDSEFVSPDMATRRIPLARRTRTTSTMSSRLAVTTTLYIQMEYCERHTLRDLIRKGLYNNEDEIWRLLREIVDGLAHIHSHGIIHRDLKPDNIFIDVTNDPKIGDFGLATSGQHASASQRAKADIPSDDMTRSIGTTLYVAPELKSDSTGQYNDKVDMYSLGIILFEMCCPLPTAMERVETISKLRLKDVTLPARFSVAENAQKCNIIQSLLTHKPSERPSSSELLRSGKIPVEIQDETVQQALRGLTDSASPYYLKLMESLFSMTPTRQIKDQVWDLELQSSGLQSEPLMPIMQMLVKQRLCDIFYRHGAVEVQRQAIFPRSPYYSSELVVQMLNPAGTLVQLPYDLTLPGARALARSKPPADKIFAFGQVFRDVRSGNAPRANGAVDFDIISQTSLDPALKEAEVLKILDEIVHDIPSLRMAQMCFHLNHSVILDVILDFCRINVSQRGVVKEVLSRLNIQDNSWIKVRNELRAPSYGIASTSLDDLVKFDFRDNIDKTIAKLKEYLGEQVFQEKLQPTFTHLAAVLRFMKHFRIRTKAYICPLSCYNEKFFRGGILLQCLFDSKKREVLAAGGRYDSLIEDHRPRVGQAHFTGCRAVGMSLGWDRLVSSMIKVHKGSSKSSTFLKRSANVMEEMKFQWPLRRCSVIVASFDSKTSRSTALDVLAELWANNISAELAADATSLEELTARYRDEKHSWIIIIKSDVVFGRSDVKVKSLMTKQDTDVSMDNLVPWLRAEIRDRDQREGQTDRTRSLHRSQAITTNKASDHTSAERPANVQILLAQHKGKKTNRGNVIESAQSRVQEHLASFGGAPIAAVETNDALLELVRTARLSDAESWKRVVQNAPANDRSYIQSIQAMLQGFRNDYLESGANRVAFVFNFRTGWIGMYDLSL